MSARVQGPPRDFHPTVKALILFVTGIVCMTACLAVAWVLAQVAGWLWNLLGLGLWLLIALFIGWVAHKEKERFGR